MLINILGYKYEIVESNTTNTMGNNFGLLDFQNLEMIIAADMPEQQRVSTIIHEVIEALNIHLSIGLEHPQITMLETGIYNVLIENGVNLSKLGKK